MRRRLFTLASLLSLLLCVATVVMWVRSFWHVYRLAFWTALGQREVMVGGGRFAYENEPERALNQVWVEMVKRQLAPLTQRSNELDARTRRQFEQVRQSRDPVEAKRGAIARIRESYDEQRRELDGEGDRWIKFEMEYNRKLRVVPLVAHRVSCVAVAGIFAVLPSSWMAWRWAGIQRHKRRQVMNRCVVCSYDRTGNTSGVCPECGTAIDE